MTFNIKLRVKILMVSPKNNKRLLCRVDVRDWLDHISPLKSKGVVLGNEAEDFMKALWIKFPSTMSAYANANALTVHCQFSNSERGWSIRVIHRIRECTDFQTYLELTGELAVVINQLEVIPTEGGKMRYLKKGVDAIDSFCDQLRNLQ